MLNLVHWHHGVATVPCSSSVGLMHRLYLWSSNCAQRCRASSCPRPCLCCILAHICISDISWASTTNKSCFRSMPCLSNSLTTWVRVLEQSIHFRFWFWRRVSFIKSDAKVLLNLFQGNLGWDWNAAQAPIAWLGVPPRTVYTEHFRRRERMDPCTPGNNPVYWYEFWKVSGTIWRARPCSSGARNCRRQFSFRLNAHAPHWRSYLCCHFRWIRPTKELNSKSNLFEPKKSGLDSMKMWTCHPHNARYTIPEFFRDQTSTMWMHQRCVAVTS